MIHYRQATDKDFDLTFQIKRSSLKPYVDKIWGWRDTEQSDFHRKEFNPNTIRIVLDERLIEVGYIDAEHKSNTIFIVNILIDEKYQGKGIGRQILNDISADAKKEGKTVELQVFKINNRAKKLYEAIGFRTVEETDLHFKMAYEPSCDK